MSKKKLIILLVVILLGVTGFIFVKNKNKVSPFKVETVSLGEMRVTTSASGEIAAEKDATLQFQSAGLLSWVGVKEGDTVKKGQAIASLDTRQLKKTFQKYLNTYQSGRDTFEETQADYQPIKDRYLLTDEMRRTLDQTQMTLNNTVLDVELSDLAIKFSTIYSPFAGTLVKVTAPQAGVNILATGATFRVVDPTSLYFSALIDETDIAKVEVNAVVKVSLDAFPGQTFDAVVQRIDFDSTLSSGGGTAYKTIIYFKEPIAQLRLGMNGDAEIFQKSIPSAVLIPLSALTEKENQTFVWKLENNKTRKTIVKIGATNNELAQVVEGLSAGDRIIVSGISLLKDGMVIKP